MLGNNINNNYYYIILQGAGEGGNFSRICRALVIQFFSVVWMKSYLSQSGVFAVLKNRLLQHQFH